MITTLRGTKEKVEVSPEGPTVIIGERINPTGKPKIVDALEKRDWDVLKQEAITQIDQGARVIDVNVGAMGIDEVALLPEAVKAVSIEINGVLRIKPLPKTFLSQQHRAKGVVQKQ